MGLNGAHFRWFTYGIGKSGDLTTSSWCIRKSPINRSIVFSNERERVRDQERGRSTALPSSSVVRRPLAVTVELFRRPPSSPRFRILSLLSLYILVNVYSFLFLFCF